MPSSSHPPAETTPIMAAIVAAEFREMPGMRLTVAQAQRLWHLSPDECDDVLDYLTREGRLQRDSAGQYGLPRSR